MTTQISGDTGVSQVQDNTVTSAKIVNGTIVQADLAAVVLPLGVGQTWQDVIGSRALSTLYTNSTGRPIMVITGVGTSGTSSSAFWIDGIAISGIAAAAASISSVVHSGVVPAGSTYQLTNTAGGINRWVELR